MEGALLRAIFDVSSLKSCASSNHTCQVCGIEQDASWKNRYQLQDISALNGHKLISTNKWEKIFAMLALSGGDLFLNTTLLESIPAQLIPMLLSKADYGADEDGNSRVTDLYLELTDEERRKKHVVWDNLGNTKSLNCMYGLMRSWWRIGVRVRHLPVLDDAQPRQQRHRAVVQEHNPKQELVRRPPDAEGPARATAEPLRDADWKNARRKNGEKARGPMSKFSFMAVDPSSLFLSAASFSTRSSVLNRHSLAMDATVADDGEYEEATVGRRGPLLGHGERLADPPASPRDLPCDARRPLPKARAEAILVFRAAVLPPRERHRRGQEPGEHRRDQRRDEPHPRRLVQEAARLAREAQQPDRAAEHGAERDPAVGPRARPHPSPPRGPGEDGADAREEEEEERPGGVRGEEAGLVSRGRGRLARGAQRHGQRRRADGRPAYGPGAPEEGQAGRGVGGRRDAVAQRQVPGLAGLVPRPRRGSGTSPS
ncbi:hypothetical protein THAOC_11780, partial [Thalassiosira oceanica]